MQNICKWLGGMLGIVALAASMPVHAADATQAEIEILKRELDTLRKQVNSSNAPIQSTSVDKAVSAKYGPNAPVTTKTGKLSIGGLIQVWYYSIENDQGALFNSVDNDVVDINDFDDNDSFRIRRTEIKFSMDIHENITGVVMIDPAREATSYPSFPDNQGNIKKSRNSATGSRATAIQSGSGGVPRLLQDAYILYHGVVPHHDFQIGQYKPYYGEEGIRSSSALDFVERTMIGQFGDSRDMGVTVLGKWWDDRLQYQFGLFNGAGNYFSGSGQNRSDDNDEKDFYARILVRPLWKNETWGEMELGYSFKGGTKGEESNSDPVADPVNGLNRNETNDIGHDAWFYYAPGSAVKGLWLRAEYTFLRDRNSPGIFDPLSGDTVNNVGTYEADGFYASIGYNIGKSVFKDSAPGWLKGFEFAGRYEEFDNVHVVSPTGETTNTHVRTFTSRVYTAGINYYIKGNNAKIQANYAVVDDPESDVYDFSSVRNNYFVVNFQVAF
jgi:hypothetical protein